MYRSAFLGAVLLLIPHAVQGAEVVKVAGDPVAGESLARTLCINCHVVDDKGPLVRTDRVPSFPWIARHGARDAAALESFLGTLPHGRMQDWSLTRQEIRDVSAYIMSLREAAPEGSHAP